MPASASAPTSRRRCTTPSSCGSGSTPGTTRSPATTSTRTGTSSSAQEPQASEFGDLVPDAAPDRGARGHRDLHGDRLPPGLPAGPRRHVARRLGHHPEVLDPEKSTVADSVAFWSLPCPAINPDHCALVQPFGTWINAASKNKEAAWLLVQYLTSKEIQAAAAQAKALLTPSRLSVLQDPADGGGAAADVPRGADRTSSTIPTWRCCRSSPRAWPSSRRSRTACRSSSPASGPVADVMARR